MAYATDTKVSIARTRAEIDALLEKAGATHIGSMTEPDAALVLFVLEGRRIAFRLPLPARDEFSVGKVNQHQERYRSEPEITKAWEKACRSRWRALLLCIRAKLESVEAGIETVDEAFLAHVMTPDGRRFAEVAVPAITQAYADGGVPRLTFGGGS